MVQSLQIRTFVLVLLLFCYRSKCAPEQCICVTRDLQIGLRVRDRVRERVSNFKPVRFLESSLYMLVFR